MGGGIVSILILPNVNKLNDLPQLRKNQQQQVHSKLIPNEIEFQTKIALIQFRKLNSLQMQRSHGYSNHISKEEVHLPHLV